MNRLAGADCAADFSVADTNELDDGLSNDLRALVKSELEPGERLLWAARCDPPAESHGVGFYMVCGITLCLLGLGLLLITTPPFMRRWNDGTAGIGGLSFLGLAGVFLIGLTGAWNTRSTARRRMIRTCYAVTDRRAITWAPEPKGDAVRVETLARGEVRKLVRIERPDGSGTLQLAGTGPDIEFGFYDYFSFAHISQVRRVEQIVRSNLVTGGERL
jgi:hypothetical protein